MIFQEAHVLKVPVKHAKQKGRVVGWGDREEPRFEVVLKMQKVEVDVNQELKFFDKAKNIEGGVNVTQDLKLF